MGFEARGRRSRRACGGRSTSFREQPARRGVMSAPRALITGIAGQDGSYLAELLLGKGYEVFGIVRGSPQAHYENLAAVRDDVTLLQGDLLDQMTLLDAITTAEPDELYNLAATSLRAGLVAPAGHDRAVHRGRRDVDARGGPHHQARSCASTRRRPRRSSARRRESPQNETTPFRAAQPVRGGEALRAPHGLDLPRALRHARQLAGSSTTTSRRAGRPSSSRARSRATAAAIKLGLADELRLGDLEARRATGASPATSSRRCG